METPGYGNEAGGGCLPVPYPDLENDAQWKKIQDNNTPSPDPAN